MKQLVKLDEFYNSLNDIKIVNKNLDKQRKLLNSTISNFNADIQQITVDNDLLKQNEILGKLLTNTVDKLKTSSSKWLDIFTELLEQEKFRSDLENYFIVIVFGKVKAGKSSLGNFVSKNHNLNEKAKMFKYDEAGKEQSIKKLEELDEDSEFAVNNLECTAEIQGFKLGNMAWIDTPGLASMTKENGNLAKQYINSADYIIFPANSGEPETMDNIDAIKELIDNKKELTVIITRSDTIERRKDSSGKLLKDKNGNIGRFLVNKSKERRMGQEQGLLRSLNYDNNTLKDIFSLSVHAAQKGIDDNDEELFNNSNIPRFYETLTDVVKNKSSKLKSSAPYNGLLSFIDNKVLGKDTSSNSSVQSLLDTIKKFDLQIEEANTRFKTIKHNISNDIRASVEYIVTKHQSNISKGNEKTIFANIDNELSIMLSETIESNINEILNDFSTSLTNINSHMQNNDEFNIEDKYKNISVSYVDRSLLNIFTFGLLGRSHSSVDGSVLVGDNKDEMIRKYKENRIDGLTKVAQDNYDMIINTFFQPLENISNEMKSKIESIIKTIENQKENLKKES